MSGLKTLGFAVDDHDQRSIELYRFIADMDYEHGDTFCFKAGGDGDNGELILSYLDEWFSGKPDCDRDALLELADEISSTSCDKIDGELTVDLIDIWGWAQAIREALGVSDDAQLG